MRTASMVVVPYMNIVSNCGDFCSLLVLFSIPLHYSRTVCPQIPRNFNVLTIASRSSSYWAMIRQSVTFPRLTKDKSASLKSPDDGESHSPQADPSLWVPEVSFHYQFQQIGTLSQLWLVRIVQDLLISCDGSGGRPTRQARRTWSARSAATGCACTEGSSPSRLGCSPAAGRR